MVRRSTNLYEVAGAVIPGDLYDVKPLGTPGLKVVCELYAKRDFDFYV